MKLTDKNLKNSILEKSPEELLRICKECQQIATFDKIENKRLGNESMPVPVFPVPLIIEKEMTSSVLKKLDIYMEAMFKLEKYALSDKGTSLYDRLMNSLTEGGKHLVRQCSYESDFSLRRRHRRVDGYLDFKKGTYSIIEINQAAPLAVDFHDVSQRIATHFLNSMGFEYQPVLLAHHLLDWFVDEYRERNPGKFPATIALVIEHGYKPKFVDLPQMALICEKLAMRRYGEKLNIKVCFPYEVKLSGEKIIFEGKEVHMIWRNSVYMTKYREEGYDIEDYEKICSNPDKHLIINATGTWLTRIKEIFSIFWSEEYCKNMGLSPEEKEIVREFSPVTVNLKYTPEMEEEVVKERGQWISKPCDAGFGAGVEFGLWHSEKEWKKLVDERKEKHGFVFQKRVSYPTKKIMDINEKGNIINHLVEYDFCPQHINGKFPGTSLSRVNIVKEDGKISKMNLVGGGIILPMIPV